MLKNLLDHDRIFDARYHLDRITIVVTGFHLDFEHALQPLGPCHRDVASGRWLVRGLAFALPPFGQRHLRTQSMVRREHPVVAREVDARRRRQGGQSRHQVERFDKIAGSDFGQWCSDLSLCL